MVNKIMTKGRLEVRYRDCILEITPDWFVISDDDDIKYTCETKDSYPDNMFPKNYNSWLHLLSFEDDYVTDCFCDLIGAYINDWIEEHLEEYGMWLKQTGFDVKYTK